VNTACPTCHAVCIDADDERLHVALHRRCKVRHDWEAAESQGPGQLTRYVCRRCGWWKLSWWRRHLYDDAVVSPPDDESWTVHFPTSEEQS